MDTMIKLDGSTPENKNILVLEKAIMSILCSGTDRETAICALGVLRDAVHVTNTIMNCNFVNKVEKE
jgi:hypothetical protein